MSVESPSFTQAPSHSLSEIPSVEENFALVRYAAHPFYKSAHTFGQTMDDVDQRAALEFILKAPLYDREKGALSTYMVRQIRGALQREIRDRGRLVRLPRNIHANLSRVFYAENELLIDLGREPKDSEIADLTGIDISLVREVREAARSTATVSIQDQTAMPFAINVERISEETSPMDKVVDLEALKQAVSLLSNREKQVVYLRFWEEKTQDEIAEVVGVSQYHVSRILGNIFQKMRAFMREDEELIGSTV